MAETRSPSPEDMHWGISYLREDLQDVKQDMRDFRKEVAGEFASFRKEVAGEFAAVRGEFAQQFDESRKEISQQFAEHRRETALQLRHNLMVTVGVTGVFSTIIIAFVIAFIEYRLPVG